MVVNGTVMCCGGCSDDIASPAPAAHSSQVLEINLNWS